MKIYDYMVAGLPVIASAQGRVCEMLENGVSGCLIPPGDEIALTDELIRMGQDSEMRVRLGRAARKQYLDHYTLAKTASKVIEVCTDTVSEIARKAI